MPDTSNPMVAVLRSSHTCYLLATSLVGRLPSAMAALAIVQLVRSSSGDLGFAGVMTAVYIVAGAIGQPVLGRAIDRYGQVRVLIITGISSFLALTGMALLLPEAPGVAVALAGAAGLCTPPLEPALRTLWPRLVKPGAELKAAFSLDAGAQEIIFILGPLLTVAGIAVFGPTGNLLFAGLLGLLGACAFVLSPATRTAPLERSRDVTASASASASASQRSPILIPTVAQVALFTFGIGVPVGVLTIVATVSEAARDVPGLAGWLLAVNAAGALVGATVVGIRPLRGTSARLLPIVGVSLAVGYLPLAVTALPTWAYVIAAGVSGLMLPPTLGQVFERVAQLSPPAALTEANGWIISAMTLGIGTGTLLAGLLTGTSDASMPWIIGGASGVTMVLALAVLPRQGLFTTC